MAGSATTPSVTTDAPTTPVAAANIVPVATVASARPPGIRPMISRSARNMRSAMPVLSSM